MKNLNELKKYISKKYPGIDFNIYYDFFKEENLIFLDFFITEKYSVILIEGIITSNILESYFDLFSHKIITGAENLTVIQLIF